MKNFIVQAEVKMRGDPEKAEALQVMDYLTDTLMREVQAKFGNELEDFKIGFKKADRIERPSDANVSPIKKK